jgi:hypothetical protein
MSRPLSPRLIHTSSILIEIALLWLGIGYVMDGSNRAIGFTFLGIIIVAFVLIVHLIALALIYVLPRVDQKKHPSIFIVSIALPILLVPALMYLIFISTYYAMGYAAQDAQLREQAILDCANSIDRATCIEDHLELVD